MDNTSVEMNEDNMNVWLESKVMKKLAEKLGQPYENLTWDVSSPENCFYLSCVLFIKIYLNRKNNYNGNNNKDECIQLVIKRPGVAMSTCNLFPTASFFHNEILFYKLISNKNNDYPRCFYYSEDKKDFDNMIIAMENIGTKGYEMCPDSYDIPFEYVISAMETIGKFHAMGYAMKKREPENFLKIVEEIEESRFFPGNHFNQFINIVALRPVEWLRKQNYDKHFVDLMHNYMSDTFNNIMMATIAPEEPLAVICHGDFTRNNIFFRRTEKKMTGMLFDFAMLRYTTPCIDLSTFLYLSCSNNDRRQRFDEIFEAYHSSLITNLRHEGIKDLDEYSYEKMLKDYKRKAMHGFIVAVFFMPVLRGFKQFNQEDMKNFDPVKSAELTKEAGGDALSKEFAEILLELRSTGCLDHVINP